MKNQYKKIIFSLVAILFILLPQISLAQGIKDAFGSKSPLADVQTRTGYGNDDIGTISGRVINTALTLVGIVFLLLMVYAGYLWMTAQGEDAQVKKATDIVKGTVIGLVLVLSAYAITVFVTKGLNPAASTSGQCYNISPPTNDCPSSNTDANFVTCTGRSEINCLTNAPRYCCTWR